MVMKKNQVNSTHERKMYEGITKRLDTPREPRKYEIQGEMLNDVTQLVHQLAVFDKTEYRILKLSVIDYIGERFECADTKKNKWLHFNNAWLFNFTNPAEFEHFYSQGEENNIRQRSREKMLYWLKESRRKLVDIEVDEKNINQDPFIKNNKRS